jgi:hypothetical protein
MLHHKLVWRVIHQLQQLTCLVDDRGAVAPREDCCKKARDLYVLLFSIPVRNGNRIVSNEGRLVEFMDLAIKEGFNI